MPREAAWYTRDEVREIDRRAIEEFGLPGVVLMENAGRGCGELLLASRVRGPVVICCGRGNNGGDGFVIARHLENAGVDVRVLLFADIDAVTGDAAVNLHVLRASKTPLHVFSEVRSDDELDGQFGDADWIVDALLGTGARGAVREPYSTAIEAINRAVSRKFAVDLPSGLDCDLGTPLGPCVRAEVTGTLVAMKRGFQNPASAEFTGVVHTIDIGIPRELLTSPPGAEK